MKDSDKASAIETPLLGETYTLHQAIAWIAFDDPDQQLDLAMPVELRRYVSPKEASEESASIFDNEQNWIFKGRDIPFKIENATGNPLGLNDEHFLDTHLNFDNFLGRSKPPHMSEIGIWIVNRLKQREVVNQAVAKLASAITGCTFALDGWQLLDGHLNGLGLERHNPIPKTTRVHSCEIPFDFLLNDGGRLLFIPKKKKRGWDNWIAYRDVRVLRSAIEGHFPRLPKEVELVERPSEAELRRAKLAVENEARAKGFKIKGPEFCEAVTQMLLPKKPTADWLKKASKEISPDVKQLRGERGRIQIQK